MDFYDLFGPVICGLGYWAARIFTNWVHARHAWLVEHEEERG